MAKNPFRFGEKLQAAEIIDRQTEIEQLIQSIEDGKKLFLIGPRRHGKTVILHAAEDYMRQQGWHVFYFNAEAATNLNELSERIFATVTQQLIKPTKKLRKSVQNVLQRLSPNFKLDLTSGEISGSLNVTEAAEKKQVPLLVDVLDTLEALASEQDIPVGLIIDEFQAVILEGGEKAEGQIRAAIQDHRHVGYIFAGSRTRMLAEMTSDQSRPFWRLGTRLFLGRIPETEITTWLETEFKSGNYNIAPEAITALINSVEQVPYDIQRLAHATWQILQRQSARKVTPETITQAIELLIQQDAEFYLRAWNQLTAFQKIALLAVDNFDGVNLTTAQVLREKKISAPTLLKSLSALEEKGILWAEDMATGTRWRFEDPVFRLWVRTRNESS